MQTLGFHGKMCLKYVISVIMMLLLIMLITRQALKSLIGSCLIQEYLNSCLGSFTSW